MGAKFAELGCVLGHLLALYNQSIRFALFFALTSDF